MPYADPAKAKEYRREHYYSNVDAARRAMKEWRARATPEQQKAIRVSKRAYKARLRAWMREIKHAAGCIDCGTRDGRLDFDHRPGTIKLFNPSRLDRTNRKALEAEIAKCDVRCVRCHAARHGIERGGLNRSMTDAPRSAAAL